jgi:alkylhydroperoxidase family enzyme
MFEFEGSPIPVRADLAQSFRGVWQRLAAPGTWWTGAERVALANVARAAYQEETPLDDSVLPVPARDAAAVLAKTPAAISEEQIASWEAHGLDAHHYVELVAVVAMATAIDTFHRGMDLDLEPLPLAQPGAPSRALPATPATKTKAWVPMVGPPTIPSSLSAVPAEMTALEALHGPMYLSYVEMGNPAIQKGLSRAQMELVAGRTSAINECFF